jgi:UDP-N-acetylglucosamine 2-epimerase (non-hydrolysing)
MKSLRKKILTIIGTRPEIIRLSKIIPKLDKQFNNILVHTGQNYDYELDELFFKQLKVRKPNYYLNARGSFAKQISTIIYKLEKIIEKEKPSKFLVLGDTNSSVGSIVAKRMGVKVYHMEAGNRCFSNKSPEEVNRKIIDHSSDILLPYTSGSARNLLLEGIKKKNIIVTGNPITEVIHSYRKNINNSNIIKELGIQKNNYFILTMHRQENVDDENILKNFILTFNMIVKRFDKKIIWPIHPRSKKMLKKYNIILDNRILTIKPLGFFDFLKLEKDCFLTITDSGTVQEESAILKKPCLIIREYTERLETIKAGSATLLGNNTKKILTKINFYLKNNIKIKNIKDYQNKNVSSKIIKIMKK